MKDIVGRIVREKGFDYKVNKDGEIVKQRYSWIKDPYTIVVICILILGLAYYYQSSSSKANIDNLDNTCEVYSQFKERWITEHPDEIPIAKEILKTAIENNWKIER